jgi:hypothetical protein
MEFIALEWYGREPQKAAASARCGQGCVCELTDRNRRELEEVRIPQWRALFSILFIFQYMICFGRTAC